MSPILGIWASSKPGAPATAFESIATATGTGSSATITFNSIPGTYQHLQIRGIGRTTRTATDSAVLVRLNSDSGNNYARHWLEGDGTSASASGQTSQSSTWLARAAGNTAASNLIGATIIDLYDYASTTKNKTLRSITGLDANGVFTGYASLFSGLWINTNAVTSIDLIVSDGSSWTTQTTFALYGIKS